MAKHSVNFNGAPIKLTPNEFKLLYLLASRPGQILTREQLLEDLHGIASSTDRSVDSHIKNLRKKLEIASGESIIETVYGIGYRFTCPFAESKMTFINFLLVVCKRQRINQVTPECAFVKLSAA